MINTSIYILEDRILGYEIKGHSNYGKYGEDIVCAAVSILAQNTVNSILEISKLREEDYKLEIDNDGFLKFILNESLLESEEYNTIEALLRSLEIGIKSISENYPKNVKIEYRGWD